MEISFPTDSEAELSISRRVIHRLYKIKRELNNESAWTRAYGVVKNEHGEYVERETTHDPTRNVQQMADLLWRLGEEMMDIDEIITSIDSDAAREQLSIHYREVEVLFFSAWQTHERILSPSAE